MKSIAILDTTGATEETLFSFPAHAARFDSRGLLVRPDDSDRLASTLRALDIPSEADGDWLIISLDDLTAEIQ